ncbi:MAG TPA: hypothetical protein VMN39_05595 [Longimicrobiaceae bacterium]|nr:hypothetical protein [Longimicrobiaceae bacterium]
MRSRSRLTRGPFAATLLAMGAVLLGQATSLAGQQRAELVGMAERIAQSVRPAQGELVVVRNNPETFPGFDGEVRRALEAAGARVELIPYGSPASFAGSIARARAYVVLPNQGGLGSDGPELRQALGANEGLRQVHLHWQGGTVGVDGGSAEHPAAYDDVYVRGIMIDYAALDGAQSVAQARLKGGTVRLTTPAGTHLRFHPGNRPFNKQNGDASAARAAARASQIDLEIEMPAGALRVAPVEESVSGTIVVPSARFGDVTATDVRFEITRGKVRNVTASSGEAAVRAALEERPVFKNFGGFSIGFNPAIAIPPGETAIPYYGYGAGIVRISIGNNTILGGAVDQGNGDRSFYLTDATVVVGDDVIVRDGRLVAR